MDDKRFSHIVKDPKFRRLPKGRQKVKIDKRFQSMFNDKKFDNSHKIDKRGRPINFKTKTSLKQFYELDSDEEPDNVNKSKSSEDEEEKEEIKNAASSDDDNANEDLETVEEHDKQLSEDIKKKLRNMDVDYARGKSRLISESSSDDDEEESEVEDEIDTIEHNWGELDRDADETEEPTYRIAACNMDWDRIRATDLMVLFNSFLPQNGVIKSVAIYPSEFGKSRVKEEEVKGPIELLEDNSNENNGDDDDDDENEEGSKYHMEKLRQYQLNRLKYYYAVITFDSVNSANRIYNECDGMEYESSATRLDLRFIPDEMTFDDEPKEFCDKLPELNRYQPRFFTTTALQQAKVDLTWDETDLQRIEIVKKFNSGKIEEINEEDLKNFIASSSDDDSDDYDTNTFEEQDDNKSIDNKDTIEKYRKLLQEIENNDDGDEVEEGAMEMKWDLNLEQKTDEIVKSKQESNEDKTPFQKYLDKRKEKRKERKLKKKQNGDEDSDIPSDIDLDDPYFAEEFNKEEFKKKSTKSQSHKTSNRDYEENNGELELLLMNEDDDSRRQHFSLKKIQDNENTNKKKRNKKKQDIGDRNAQDDFEINVSDDRFSALFTNHLYNIDQTDPHYKKTKGMETLINEKLKRRIEADTIDDSDDNKKLKRDYELSMLVKSIKRKKK